MKKLISTTFVFLLLTLLSRAQGLNFNDEAYRKVPLKFAKQTSIGEGLPARVDLSMYVPTVKDQGRFGTCVGFATAYYARTILEAIRRKTTNQDSIDALRFSPSYLYNFIKDSTDLTCMDGTEIELALEFMKKNGVVGFAEQGYPVCENNAALKPQPSSKLSDYIKLFGLIDREENIVAATKKALSERTPVIIGIQTTASLDELKNVGYWTKLWWKIKRFFGIYAADDIAVWKPSKSKSIRSGHALCVVGYDTAKYEGAFQVVNSRGKDYGDEGFFWIRFSDYAKYTKYGYQAILNSQDDGTSPVLSAEIAFVDATFTTGTEMRFRDTLALRPTIMTFSLKDSLPTGSQFKCQLTVNQQCYLYVIGAGGKPLTTGQLIPLADSLSALIGINSKVLLPSEDSLFHLEGEAGREFLLFLFSKNPIENLEQYTDRINDGRGDFSTRIAAVFGTNLVPSHQLRATHQPKKIGFELRGKYSGQIVPILVSFEHIAEKPNRRAL